jgi:hypothetical protein
LACEAFGVPSPLGVDLKSQYHADEQQNTWTLAILSEEKGESERCVSLPKIKRSKLAVAERRLRLQQWPLPMLTQALQELWDSSAKGTRRHH